MSAIGLSRVLLGYDRAREPGVERSAVPRDWLKKEVGRATTTKEEDALEGGGKGVVEDSFAGGRGKLRWDEDDGRRRQWRRQ